jgi:hypothetical protein
MKAVIAYLVGRLAEASTWRGLVALATAAGVAISPELAEAIIAAGLAGIGVIGVVAPDLKPKAE